MQTLENFICEYDKLKIVYDIEINEKFGTYDGQVELVDKLARFMLANRQWMRFEISKEDLDKQKMQGIFCKKLIVDWSESKNAYDAYSSKIVDNLFDKVFIKIDCQLMTYKEISKALLHELTHAWHNYCLMAKSGKSLIDIINDQSHIRQLRFKEKMFDDLPRSSLEYKIFKTVDDLCYFTREEELKAFKSELKAEILSLKTNVDLDFNTFLNVLKSSETYQSCVSLLFSLDKIKSLDKTYKNLFVDAYKSIRMSNWKFDKIWEKENRRLEELKNELEKLGAKIYCEWVERISQKSELVDNNIGENNFKSIDISDVKFDIKTSKQRVEECEVFNDHDRFMSLLVFESLNLRRKYDNT